MSLPNNNYICISDLHLGAKYSILSSRESETGLYQSNKNSDCLTQLLDCLRNFNPKAFATEDLPGLIIVGDCLDFSFGTMDDIVKAFSQFIGLLFPENKPALVSKEIIYVPGNHDHRIWQSTKDQLVVENYVDKNTTDNNLNQTTSLYRESELTSNLLNSLAQQVNKTVSVNLRYPNLGLKNNINGREIYLHHGHFIESTYRLMTVINQLISGIDDPNIEELERQNGGWIDFFWSSLGASSIERDNAVLLFDIMQNPAATQRYAQKLARLFCDYLSKNYSISPQSSVYRHISVEKMVTGVIDATLGRAFQLERGAFEKVLTKESLKGLQWYLSQPLRKQIIAEQQPTPSHQTPDLETHASFIFGHTHKPFQDQIFAEGFKYPLNVFNCGGWVVDKPDYTSVQGGAVVFIDKEFNLASLRLYQAPVNGEMPVVCAEGIGCEEDKDNLLLERMRKVLLKNSQQKNNNWLKFQSVVKEAIELRAKEAREKFFDATSSPGIK